MQLGDRLGPWSLSHLIDYGYTGEVWLARASEFRFAALKILRDPDTGRRRARFQSEVDFLRSEAANIGVMPVIDADTSPDADAPWYSMPVAETLLHALGSTPTVEVEAVVAAFVQIAATMTELHARGFRHTDLRPVNLFHLDGRWVVGDGGGFERWDSPAARDAGPNTDEVRLGRSLWEMLRPPEIRMHDAVRPLVGLVEHPWIPALDSIVARSMDRQGRSRLTMHQIHSELVALGT